MEWLLTCLFIHFISSLNALAEHQVYMTYTHLGSGDSAMNKTKTLPLETWPSCLTNVAS